MPKSCILSEEIVMRQIVSRLPPKTLMRFKCACKLWYKVINTHSFVTMHLSNSMHNKFSSLVSIVFKHTILNDNNIVEEEEIYHVLTDSSDRKQALLSKLDLCKNHDLHSVVQDFIVPPPMGLAFFLQIVGHCDGIICLSTYAGSDRAALCNPSIKEFKCLPKSCLVPPPNVAYSYSLGFGYDSKSKDYKIVRIASPVSHGNHPTRGEVYSLDSNSWREINTDFTTEVLYCTPGSSLYFKGNCYWWGFKKEEPDSYKDFILSFDMENELFHHVPIPDTSDVPIPYLTSLVVLKESIALLSYPRYGPKTFEVWGMEGDFRAGKDLWTKYFTVGPLEGVEIPLLFWKSDELLLVTENANAVAYNLCTQKFKHLPVHGVEEANTVQAVLYVNSIVSINPKQQ